MYKPSLRATVDVLLYLVVDALIEVLYEDITLARLSQRRITLRPHNATRLILDQRVVKVLERSFAICRVEIIDVGIAKRTTGNGITTHSDTTTQSTTYIR